MKKNIGSVLALYPTPTVIVGAFVENKANWLLVAHVGIMGHDRIVVSLAKHHYTNNGIKSNGCLSVNIVDESMLKIADYAGCVSGAKEDKSTLFKFDVEELGTPVIDDSPLVMECKVLDNYETDTFDNFVCSISATYAKEDIIDDNNKIDYNKLKPVLFEMPSYSYLRTGDIIGKCRSLCKGQQS